MLEIDICHETHAYSEHMPDIDWQTLTLNAATAAVAASPYEGLLAPTCMIECSVRLVEDQAMAALNHQTRGKNVPTNVLSYQYHDAHDIDALVRQGGGVLGDIVLSYETIAREAEAQKKSFPTHYTHLVVHAMLHLLGFDHEQGEAEAEEMEALERAALARLGLPDPYQVPL